MLEPLALKVGNREVVEQASIAGALKPAVLTNSDQALAAAEYIARRLDSLASKSEKGWRERLTKMADLPLSDSYAVYRRNS